VIGSVCLSLFLTWTMMTLHLGDAVQMAGPLLIILAAQAALVAAWATWVTFPAVGRDYESAIIAGAFCGFAMGATTTTIANMQALTRRHGPAPQAFVVVPIVGTFFIDKKLSGGGGQGMTVFGALQPIGSDRGLGRSCEGFRTTAHCDSAGRHRAVVRKRPGKEPAGS
jgi:hypothetical protein